MSLTAVYQNELKRTRTAVANALRTNWRALPDYRDGQVDRFVGRVVPLVEAGQRRAVTLTDAYLSKKLGVQPLGLQATDLVGAAVRKGMDPSVVYARPFTTVWTSIEKIGFNAAVEKGLSRLMSTADMDVALSTRAAAGAYSAQSGRANGFYRRADPGCCDFCLSIDGAFVLNADASPLHNRCGCTLEEADGRGSAEFPSFAPGSVIGDMRIEDHGELGALITAKADNFTSLADLPSHYKHVLAVAEKEFGQP